MIHLFYRAVHLAYLGAFGRPQMLHYPLHETDGQTLLEGQTNFTEACLARLGDLHGRQLIDIGCGNGVQTLHIAQTREPAAILGVDLDAEHVRIASAAAAERAQQARVRFAVDDAQRLDQAADGAFDAALCTESAHHYPDKDAFVAQLGRVLRPGGRFVIADLLLREGVRPGPLDHRLSLFHWPIERYRAALPAHGLHLHSEEDITERLIAGFQDRDAWFANPAAASWPKRIFARALGRVLVALYLYELRHRYRYFLLAGARV